MSREINDKWFQIILILIEFLLGLLSVYLIAEINYFQDNLHNINKNLGEILQVLPLQTNEHQSRNQSQLESPPCVDINGSTS